MKDNQDVAFYLKLFPILSLHPQAYEKAKAIACEGSNEKAVRMLEDAYAGKKLPQPSCETGVVDENIKLGARLGINATPAMVFSDGSVSFGSMKADELLKAIEEKAAAAEGQ